MSFNEDAVSVSELILNLCKHLSKNNSVETANLYKLASSVLSSSSSSLASGSSSDEPLITAQIKHTLSSQSEEHANKFELLYANICKSNILHQRWATLSFLLNVSLLNKNTPVRYTLTEFDRFKAPLSKNKLSKPSMSLNPSQESIKQLFDGYENRQFNFTPNQSTSATRIHSSQATTVSSAVWSKNDCLSHTSRLSSLQSVTEIELLQDVIYSLQGIEGKYLRKEPGGLGFVVDPKQCKSLTVIQRGLVERLIGTSFLHNQLKKYCNDNDKHSGIICQALIATLRDELSNYYKTVALLQAGMKQNSLEQMTLRRCLFLIYDHHSKFEWLAYIAEVCNEKKGGALITAIHGFLQHGSKCAQEISEKVLTSVCKPLYIMLSRWLLDGEINDPCNEFFIETRGISKAERLWHDKYHVRESMVPSFITMDQANKILATGKSINFLRQICKDGGELPGRDLLQKLFKTTSAEALFAPEQSLEFHAILENVYRETSLRVLDLLKNKFRLFEHLQSLRKYLLLGQGDFIRHLMELLAPELNKPGVEIYSHTLTAILESAIRVTNAQYEDEDTLKRLNIKVLVPSLKDSGWDVFSLVYAVDGPVGTIFQPTMRTYESLFGALWRAKRMEYLLTNMRKQQITMSKLFKNIRELKPIMHTIHILTSEMIHFLHQTQYYFLFEVLECSWAEMLTQVNKAECLDDIIKAHTKFLSSVQCGVLLDESSRDLLMKIVSIYNFVVQLEGLQDVLYICASKEYDAFMEYRRKTEQSETFGPTLLEDEAAKARIAEFHVYLNATKINVKHLAESYSSFVRDYLVLLSSSSNMNLQLLSVRLNFNDYYKIM